jgi:hypothetical protein
MSDLSALRAGDDLVVTGHRNCYHRKVAKVGRVWLTDDAGVRYRIADGRAEGQQFGTGVRAMTVADWELHEEAKRLTERLQSWGWAPGLRGKHLTLDQLRRAAALLSEFESENNGGLL